MFNTVNCNYNKGFELVGKGVKVTDFEIHNNRSILSYG